MDRSNYKNLYHQCTGDTWSRTKTIIKKYRKYWDVEEFDSMIDDVLISESSTAEDVIDILALIRDQQGGNAEFKRAFFTLKAEVTKSHKGMVKPSKDLVPELPLVDDIEVEDE